MRLFDDEETTADLDALLHEAGHDPDSPVVKEIKTIISGYYAGLTAGAGP